MSSSIPKRICSKQSSVLYGLFGFLVRKKPTIRPPLHSRGRWYSGMIVGPIPRWHRVRSLLRSHSTFVSCSNAKRFLGSWYGYAPGYVRAPRSRTLFWLNSCNKSIITKKKSWLVSRWVGSCEMTSARSDSRNSNTSTNPSPTGNASSSWTMWADSDSWPSAFTWRNSSIVRSTSVVNSKNTRFRFKLAHLPLRSIFFNERTSIETGIKESSQRCSLRS